MNELYAIMQWPRRRLISGISALLLTLTAFVLLPTHVINPHKVFIAMIFSSAFAVSLGIFLSTFPNQKEFLHYRVLAAILSFFFFALFFHLYERWQVDKELNRYGSTTFAEVLDGMEFERSVPNISNLSIRFTTADSQIVKANVSPRNGSLDGYYVGQRVAVIYSWRHPEIVRILDSHDKVFLDRLREKLLDKDSL